MKYINFRRLLRTKHAVVSAPFSYEPLQPGEFRLLRVLDDTGLDLEIAHYALGPDPEYNALSYCWEAPRHQQKRYAGKTFTIRLNGVSIEIQPNLHDALCHLATRVRKKDRLFWIDFLCINQTDLQERSLQVILMKKIYENACFVYGWLGVPKDDERMRLGVALMNKIMQMLVPALHANYNEFEEALLAFTKDSDIYPRPGTEVYKSWTAILEMYNAQFWRRTWIYQEVTRSGPVEFFSGHYSFDFTGLWCCGVVAQHLARETDVDLQFTRGITSMTYVFNIRIIHEWRSKAKSMDLLSIMQETRLSQCTDPRDKIYGVLALVETELDILPDYRKSIQEVYTDIVKALIHQHGLRILDFVIHPVKDSVSKKKREIHDPILPTWVPDWRKEVTVVPFVKSGFPPFHGSDSEVAVAYKAGGGRRTQAMIKDLVLVVDGFQIDRVSLLTSISENASSKMEHIKAWAEIIPQGKYVSGESSELALLKTIVADFGKNTKGRDSHRYSRGYMMDWQVYDDTGDLSSSRQTEKQNLFRAVHNATRHRRLCVTQKGYIGLVPDSTQIGDIVCVFLGGEVLYILRETEDPDRHEFVGEAYVHGLMDGEAFSDEFPQHKEPVAFNLV